VKARSTRRIAQVGPRDLDHHPVRSSSQARRDQPSHSVDGIVIVEPGGDFEVGDAKGGSPSVNAREEVGETIREGPLEVAASSVGEQRWARSGEAAAGELGCCSTSVSPEASVEPEHDVDWVVVKDDGSGRGEVLLLVDLRHAPGPVGMSEHSVAFLPNGRSPTRPDTHDGPRPHNPRDRTLQAPRRGSNGRRRATGQRSRWLLPRASCQSHWCSVVVVFPPYSTVISTWVVRPTQRPRIWAVLLSSIRLVNSAIPPGPEATSEAPDLQKR